MNEVIGGQVVYARFLLGGFEKIDADIEILPKRASRTQDTTICKFHLHIHVKFDEESIATNFMHARRRAEELWPFW